MASGNRLAWALRLLALIPRVGPIAHVSGGSHAELLRGPGRFPLDLHRETDRLDREVRKPGDPLADQPHLQEIGARCWGRVNGRPKTMGLLWENIVEQRHPPLRDLGEMPCPTEPAPAKLDCPVRRSRPR